MQVLGAISGLETGCSAIRRSTGTASSRMTAPAPVVWTTPRCMPVAARHVKLGNAGSEQASGIHAVADSNALTTGPAAIHPDIERLLFTEEEIQSSIKLLGKQLALEYKDKRPLLLSTLAGAFMFSADLCRAMTPVPDGLQIDFPRASSYGQAAVSSGKVELQFNLQIPIEGRHVLLIEDLIDTGRTLHALIAKLEEANPASIKVVTLLRKAIPREVEVEPDYFCLEFDDGFIVGYGIDYAENYRSLPHIGILKPSVYS